MIEQKINKNLKNLYELNVGIILSDSQNLNPLLSITLNKCFSMFVNWPLRTSLSDFSDPRKEEFYFES